MQCPAIPLLSNKLIITRKGDETIRELLWASGLALMWGSTSCILLVAMVYFGGSIYAETAATVMGYLAIGCLVGSFMWAASKLGIKRVISK